MVFYQEPKFVAGIGSMFFSVTHSGILLEEGRDCTPNPVLAILFQTAAVSESIGQATPTTHVIKSAFEVSFKRLLHYKGKETTS